MTHPPEHRSDSAVSSASQVLVGATDAGLVVERVCGDTEALIGEPPSAVVGRSLLSLVEVPDVAALLNALAQELQEVAVTAGIRMGARLRGEAAVSTFGQLVVLPLRPVASCAFVFTPVPGRRGDRVEPSGREQSSSVASCAWPALVSRLTKREVEILRRLARGDRVRRIAEELFLAQSTVRNHLSSAYSKLGVASQQAAIDLLRASGAGPARPFSGDSLPSGQ